MDATTAMIELLLLLSLGLLTPGPNALTTFAHSGLFGKKANIPLITGMAIGFVSIEIIILFCALIAIIIYFNRKYLVTKFRNTTNI